MFISVIIPSFNRAHVLPRALDSVLNQIHSEPISQVEVIVVDDGSDDGTADLIGRDYPQVVLIRQHNQGVSAARNTGIRAAQGDWLAFLDSDDEWLPHKLVAQAEELRKSSRLICHTEEIWIRNGVRVNQMNKHKKSGGEIFERCLPLCAMSPSSIIIHKSVFDEVGLFDEDLPACEDYDLWLRITAGHEVDYVQNPCINKFGGHDDQLSRAYWGMDRFRVVALAKLLGTQTNKIQLTECQRAAALAMLSKKNKILLNGARKHGNQPLIDQCLERARAFEL